MANRPASHYPDIGVLGEDIVAQWLQETGWIILHRRWRCPWGELDLVAKLDPHYQVAGVQKREGDGESGRAGENHATHPPITPSPHHPITPSPHHRVAESPLLAFVEVKTRSKRNWDAGGLLAITPQKQTKLWQAAQCFLSAYPDFADYPCRFDVALVSYQKLSNHEQSQSPKTPFINREAIDISSLSIQLGRQIKFAGYQLVLQEYLPSAFD